LDIEGGGDEFADLKQKLDEIDVDREILDKPSAIDGARKFFKDGISKILKPLVGLALIYHWFKKDKQISTEERASRLLGRSPYSPGQDSVEKKPSKKEVLLSIQKELKNIRSTFDAHLRAPKGGVSIKGKEFKGGEFIPSEGGYAEEYEKMKKEGKTGSSEENKEEKADREKGNKQERRTKRKAQEGKEAHHLLSRTQTIQDGGEFLSTKRLPPTKVLNKKGEEVEKPGALVMEMETIAKARGSYCYSPGMATCQD